MDTGTHRLDVAAGVAQGLLGVEFENLGRAGGLADALGQDLAFLAREPPAQISAARQQIGADEIQRIRTLLRGASREAGRSARAAWIASLACCASADA